MNKAPKLSKPSMISRCRRWRQLLPLPLNTPAAAVTAPRKRRGRRTTALAISSHDMRQGRHHRRHLPLLAEPRERLAGIAAGRRHGALVFLLVGEKLSNLIGGFTLVRHLVAHVWTTKKVI